jgi:hypothetical protein
VDNVKKDVYRQIAAWLNAFDRIVWESDLSLKQMAEAPGEKKEKRKQQRAETGKWGERTPEDRQIEASQKYRQIAGQHQLRNLVKRKHADRLQNEKAAYSTQTCAECGASVKAGAKLLLECENGHKRDQDVATAVYFLNKIEGAATISAPPVEIPAHLRPYLRVMRASEVRLEIVEKP